MGVPVNPAGSRLLTTSRRTAKLASSLAIRFAGPGPAEGTGDYVESALGPQMKFLARLIVLLGVVAISCSNRPEPTPIPVPNQATLDETNPALWVGERIEAIVDLYHISSEGQAWLIGYDLRQMVGMPGWFGSTGYDGWAGVGQAIPSSVIHEVSHSYFGAFPVSGDPGLSWVRTGGATPSPALKQYQRDLVTFMAQPPDGFEPLRERFRNLPGLSRKENPDLFHFGEADLLYTTGANSQLIPPILRRYFDRFLDGNDFQTWHEAIGWYLALPDQEKTLANQYIGITHLPLERYRPLKGRETAHVPLGTRALLLSEQRQRLVDFAQQFDRIVANELSFVDAASVDRSFQFWRGYLREMLALHEAHADVLVGAGGRGRELQEALDIFVAAENLSAGAQVEHFKEALTSPLVMDLAVLIPDRPMMELFGRQPQEDPPRTVEGAVRRFVQKLTRYAGAVGETLSLAKDDLDGGSESLEGFLNGLSDDELEKDLGLVFDLMRESDRTLARSLVDRLSGGLISRILESNPGALRSGNVSPERLLEVLEITPRHSGAEIASGLATLFQLSSGNFQIDRPFTRLAHDIIDDVADRDGTTGLMLLRDGGVPLIDFITDSPKASVKILSFDLAASTKLISDVDGYAYTPPGVVHRLISVDPALAAKVVVHMDAQGRKDIAIESLIVFAFDAERSRDNPTLGLSLTRDREFLEHLIGEQGLEWVKRHVALAIARYQRHVETGRIDERFIQEYAATLRDLIGTQPDPDKQTVLVRVLDQAFIDAGAGSLTRLATAPERGPQDGSSPFTSAEELFVQD